MSEKQTLISIQNCILYKGDKILLKPFSWQLKSGETWLVTGPNGGGKSSFVEALGSGVAANEYRAHGFHFEPEGDGALYYNKFQDTTALVSLEVAAALIAEERANDEGDYIEGGIDIGRTARKFIQEVLPCNFDSDLSNLPEIKLCGISSVLDRGLKYLSTGEIRRVLLCRSLLSKRQFLILSDPFAGLDVTSRQILNNFFSTIATSNNKNISMTQDDSICCSPTIILCMERYTEIPEGITNVLEFENSQVSFCGTIDEYDKIQKEKNCEKEIKLKQEKLNTEQVFQELHVERKLFSKTSDTSDVIEENQKELVRMKDVTVAWGDHIVLDKLSWTLNSGEHWLIRGPNGSGKTTFLELITGDNMQVFCNDVSIFGKRRGSGETIWELKEKMGIVSYRLHLEYRMLGGTDLEAVLLSGLHDSIGLYEQRSQVEQITVKKWLAFGGFEGREHETFGSLSYGEQRAILILRAVVKCPPLLILDEPCHGLDENHRNRILNLLEAIAQTGSTTLLHVTHDITEVLPCEKHILELCPNEKPMYKIIHKES